VDRPGVDLKKRREIQQILAYFKGAYSSAKGSAKITVPGYNNGKAIPIDKFRELVNSSEIKLPEDNKRLLNRYQRRQRYRSGADGKRQRPAEVSEHGDRGRGQRKRG
jgi:hypothetical protein